MPPKKPQEKILPAIPTKPWVLNIYMGKPEIRVGSFRKLQRIWAVI